MLRVTFLCTGNVCRSPYAEGSLCHATSGEAWQERIQVRSAGLLNLGGAHAHEHMIQIAQQRGFDLTEHRSQIITAEILRQSDLILGMDREHVRTLREIGPHAARVFLLGSYPEAHLDGPEVPDPIGRDHAEFVNVADQIDGLILSLTSQLATLAGVTNHPEVP